MLALVGAFCLEVWQWQVCTCAAFSQCVCVCVCCFLVSLSLSLSLSLSFCCGSLMLLSPCSRSSSDLFVAVLYLTPWPSRHWTLGALTDAPGLYSQWTNVATVPSACLCVADNKPADPRACSATDSTTRGARSARRRQNRPSCEPCTCSLPLMWMWQLGSPVARGLVACADAALSDARFASVARPGIARSQNRVLPFRSMVQQIRAQRLSQVSPHGSWTVLAGFARRGRPPDCLTDAGSVYSKEFRTWL